MANCQMMCGRCKEPAAFELKVGGAEMGSIDLTTLKIKRHRAPNRIVRSCAKHRKNLERCGELNGVRGDVVAI